MPDLDGLTVLVVDGSEDYRELASHALRHAGAEVRTFATPAAAVARGAAAHEVDVVLWDLETSTEGIAELRSALDRSRPPDRRPPSIVGLSPLASRSDPPLASAADRCIAKPGTPGEILEAVAEISGR